MTEKELEALLQSSCSSASFDWYLAQMKTVVQEPFTKERLDVPLAMARRRMGENTLSLSAYAHWSSADAARVLLLMGALRLGDLTVVSRAYQLGDEYEKEAILKGASLLDPQGQLASLVVDACRTNIESMMASIALANPYPARVFNEHSFNQMVLKCLFMGFNISAVFELEDRTNLDLSRMCLAYCQERAAANREIPESIWLAIRAQDIPEAKPLFVEYLNSENEQHRGFVVQSLIRSKIEDPTLVDALQSRLQSETNRRIRQSITDFIG